MTTQPQTETPETDARAVSISITINHRYQPMLEIDADLDGDYVTSGFARDLERRLRALETERDDLARWKREALEVAIQLQVQEIGREIGVGLGRHISPAILPWIREQKKKLKALETAAEGMATALEKIAPSNDFLDCPCDNDGRWNCPCFNIAQQALTAYRALLPPTEK